MKGVSLVPNPAFDRAWKRFMKKQLKESRGNNK